MGNQIITEASLEGYTIEAVAEPASPNDPDIEVVDFDYDGYQVVRGEFFSHIYEPSFTFCASKVYVNSTCLKKIPDKDYVQILVNPDEKKLAVKPCFEDERDSFRWCSGSKKRAPKQITCRMFFAKVISLMDWNPDYRYKLLGKLVKSNDELLFIFDLTAPEIFSRKIKDDGRVKTSRTPQYPDEWKNQFGLSYEEHKKQVQIGTFDGFTVFGITKEPKNGGKDEQNAVPETMHADRSKKEPDKNTQSNPASPW